MKIFMDDERETPNGYSRVYDIAAATRLIRMIEDERDTAWLNYLGGYFTREQLDWWLEYSFIEEISCDNDLGPGEAEGYKLLDWLEATGRNYPIRIHTSNPAARERMRAIIERNGWTEIR